MIIADVGLFSSLLKDTDVKKYMDEMWKNKRKAIRGLSKNIGNCFILDCFKKENFPHQEAALKIYKALNEDIERLKNFVDFYVQEVNEKMKRWTSPGEFWCCELCGNAGHEEIIVYDLKVSGLDRTVCYRCFNYYGGEDKCIDRIIWQEIEWEKDIYY